MTNDVRHSGCGTRPHPIGGCRFAPLWGERKSLKGASSDMSNDLVPAPTSSSALTQFLQELNLPHVIAGPAGKALSRLVAGALEIPVAYMDRFAQEIRNKTEARQVVSKEVAAAAARFAAADEDIVARAVYNLIAKEYRHQKSKEDIAKKTIEILQQDSAGGQAQPQQPLPDVDDEWMNVFERHAQEATNERMQLLWARILAGEIRQPKEFLAEDAAVCGRA